MRDYSKVSWQFWTGETGKSLRGNPQAQLIALYLMTSPHANMIGIYNCPIIYIAHETGSTLEGATKGLQTLCEGGFCTYEEASDTVWVHEMARYQIGDELKDNDKRVSGIQKLYDAMPEGRIKTGFYRKYRDLFHIKIKETLASPLEAPTKPETETETETELKAPPSPKGSGFDPRSFLKTKGVEEPLLSDWLKVRKSKKAPVTETAMTLLEAEAGKAGLPLADVLKICVEKNWQGFKAEWLGSAPAAQDQFRGVL